MTSAPPSPLARTSLSSALLDAVDQRIDQERATATSRASEEPLPTQPEASQPEVPEFGTDGLSGFTNSIMSGIVEAGFQTKDFFLGEPAEEDKSWFRKEHESFTRDLTEDNAVNSITQDISQFATGLIGVGKLAAPIQAIQNVKNSGVAGRVAYEVGQGAIAGFLVLDPHEERLSDLIEQYEPLRNPVTQYLAYNEDDPAVVGRLKNALEGIGMDLALAGVFAASLRGLKALRKGDRPAAQQAFQEAEVLSAARDADVSARSAIEGTPLAVEPPEGIPQITVTRADPEPQAGSTTAPVDGPAPRPDVEIDPVRTDAEAVPLVPRDQEYTPRVRVEEPDVADIVTGTRQDIDAVRRYGSREAAIEAGHVFARPKLPWQRLNTSSEVDDLVANTAKVLREQMDAAKGGAVLSDQRVAEMVRDSAELFGEDPDLLMGHLARAGKNASTMAADMEAAYIVSRRMFEDAHEVAAKIKNGLLDEFQGNVEAANAELLRRFQAAADMMASAQSMRASAGRALRRNRREFAITPKDIETFKSIPPKRLAEVLESTKGDIRKLSQAAHPAFWRRVLDEGAFLLTNNLLWNWTTHAVNASTNLYMLAARPAEKLIGSLAMGSRGSAIRRQAMQEYAYMLYSMGDAWEGLVQAFLRGDSIMAPHQTEYFQGGSRVAAPEIGLKPIKDTWDLFHNGLIAANYKQLAQAAGSAATGAYRVGVGFPTRALGAMDEFNKQLRYRAVVQARASVEASDAGLAGSDLKRHVQKRLDEAFTPDGRAVDEAATVEAQITTFQQELLPDTLGKATQNFRHNWPVATFVLPFVKTPINVLRYATKMTPALNMLQKEYRDSLLGKMGTEAQAHALGQMALGSIFMGIASQLALSGKITGSGPSDHRVRQQLEATGWQPYSFVFEGEDGTKSYFPIGRFDPVGMPFGMVADIVDMMVVNPGNRKAEEGIMSVGIALASAFSEKTFLMNLNQVIKAMADPGGDAQNLQAYLSGLAGNMIPGSSGIRAYVNQDPYMREARTFIDRMMSGMPGYSETIAPRRDWAGDPMWRKRGLMTEGSEDLVDSEINRIIHETGYGPNNPSASHNGVDLRKVELSDGSNAYDMYQQFVANPGGGPTLKEAVARLIESPSYERLVDGDPQLNGTKLGAIMDVVRRYREAGKAVLLRTYPELRQQLLQSQADVMAALREKQPSTRSPNEVEEMLRSMGY